MRHRKSFSRLNRPADQRKALMRSLITALFEYSSINTTEAKGKALKKEAEKLLSKARGGDEQKAIKTLMSVVYTKSASINALPYTKADRIDGLVSIVRTGQRKGDNADMVQVFLTK